MNNIEKMLNEQMEQELFQNVISDTFDFVDTLIDHEDLEKISNKEEAL